MRHVLILVLGFLLVSTPALSQKGASDSQTLQALLSEVRQLRQDLQNTTVAAQKAQLLQIANQDARDAGKSSPGSGVPGQSQLAITNLATADGEVQQ